MTFHTHKNMKNKGSNEDCFNNCWIWDQQNQIILELVKGGSLKGSGDTPMFNPHINTLYVLYSLPSKISLVDITINPEISSLYYYFLFCLGYLPKKDKKSNFSENISNLVWSVKGLPRQMQLQQHFFKCLKSKVFEHVWV